MKKGQKHNKKSIERMIKSAKEKFKNGFINPMKGKKRPDLVAFNKRTKSKLLSDLWKNERWREDTIKKISGENNYLWKGGEPSSNYLERNRGEGKRHYKKWRKAVLERDNNTCQICRVTKKLNAHHKKLFAKYPKLRWEVSNGITLCESCHHDIHYG